MKIYTKTGDNGTTSLIGGTRVSKSDKRIEAYGTIDELNSYIGLIRDLYNNNETSAQLLDIQNKLFIVGSTIANEKPETIKLPTIEEKDIIDIERFIDNINKDLPEIKTFIIPGGHHISSFCQIARTKCRKAERILAEPDANNLQIRLSTTYLNRLSDYLFVLARKVLKDFNKSEILWNPTL